MVFKLLPTTCFCFLLIVPVNIAHKCVCCHSQLRKYRYSCENIKYYKLGSVRTAQHSKSYTASDIYAICTCTKAEKDPHGEELQCWPGTRTPVLSALTGVEHGLRGGHAKVSNATSGYIPPIPHLFCVMMHRLPHLHLTAQQELTPTTVLHPVTIWSRVVTGVSCCSPLVHMPIFPSPEHRKAKTKSWCHRTSL